MAGENDLKSKIEFEIKGDKEVKAVTDEMKKDIEELDKGAVGEQKQKQIDQKVDERKKMMEEVNKKLGQDQNLKRRIVDFEGDMMALKDTDPRNKELLQLYQKSGYRKAEALVSGYNSKLAEIRMGPEGEQGMAEAVLKEKYGKSYGDALEVLMGRTGAGDPGRGLIGKYIAAGIVGSTLAGVGGYLGAAEMTGAQISTASGLAFDYKSLTGQTMAFEQTELQNRMREVELQTKLWTTILSGGGLALGTALGSMAGMPIVGAIAGGGAGMMASSWLSGSMLGGEMESQIEQKRWLQLMGQLDPMIQQRVQAYDKYEIANVRFGQRFGQQGIRGRGLGYSDRQIREYQYMMGGIAGYDEDTFEAQLGYSRMAGLKPEQVFEMGLATRYTGQKVGAGELMGRQQMAVMTGMTQRMPDLTKGLNQLAMMMGQLGLQVGERGLTGAGMLPYAIYGDQALGRMGDLGMQTLQGIQGMFRQKPGSGADAFLFAAMRPLITDEQGRVSIRKYEMIKAQGLAYEEGDAFKTMLTAADKYGTGTDRGFFTLKALTGDTPQGTILADALAKRMEEEYPEGHLLAGRRKGAEGVIEEWEEMIKLTDEELKESEEQSGTLAYILKEGRKGTSGAEKHYTNVEELLKNLGKDIAEEFRESQIELMQVQNKAILEHWDDILEEWDRSNKSLERIIDEIWGEREKQGLQYLKYQKGDITTDEEHFLWNLSYQKEDALKYLKKEDEGKLWRIEKEHPGPGNTEPNEIWVQKIDTGEWYVIKSGLRISENEKFNIGSIEEKDIMRQAIRATESEIYEKYDEEIYKRDYHPYKEGFEEGFPPKKDGQGEGGKSDINIYIDAADIAAAVSMVEDELTKVAAMARPTQINTGRT